MKTTSDVDLKGKVVIVRIDVNSPVDKANGRISVNPRIRSHAEAIHELSHRGARLVIIAHQGRPEEYDFLTMEQHAEKMEELMGHKIKYVDAHVGPKVESAIKGMKDGDIILLENVRMHAHEMDKPFQSELVAELSKFADYYVLDALSVAHRNQASIVGFYDKVPSLAGAVLAAELKGLDHIKQAKEVLLILGGSKVKDTLKILSEFNKTGKVSKALIGGANIILFMKAKGLDVGESEAYYRSSGMAEFLEDAKKLMASMGDRLVLPVDVGILQKGQPRIDQRIGEKIHGQIMDIGRESAEIYAGQINGAKNIFMNGPLGVYEVEGFEHGTKAVMHAIASSAGSGSYSLMGGGHTITAAEKFGIPKHKFGYISLSGKAMIEYLLGKELPGPKMLDESEKMFFSGKQR